MAIITYVYQDGRELTIEVVATTLQKKNKEQAYPIMVADLIHQVYSQDAEFALINNYNLDPEMYGEAYAIYQAYRVEVKRAVKTALEMD